MELVCKSAIKYTEIEQESWSTYLVIVIGCDRVVRIMQSK